MEHRQPDNKKHGTQQHNLTKKKIKHDIWEKHYLTREKTEKHIQNAHMKHCDGTDNNRLLLLNNGKSSMQDSIDRE